MNFDMSSESGCGDFYIIECSIAVFYQYIFFLFVCDHWEGWDKVWHAQLGSVGDSNKMITFRF